MSTRFVPSADNRHEREEELQWANIAACDSVPAIMLLLFVQKLCTAMHEYGPAHAAGLLQADAWPFTKKRVLARIKKVIQVASGNGLSSTPGIRELETLRKSIESMETMPDLNDLAEQVHQINHRICDHLRTRDSHK